MALSSPVGFLNGVRRLVQPHSLRTGDLASSGTCGCREHATRTSIDKSRGLRELLGSRTSVRSTADDFARERWARPLAGPPILTLSPVRSAWSPSRSGCSSNRPGTGARSPPEPARLGHRNRETVMAADRLRAPPRPSYHADDCCSWPTEEILEQSRATFSMPARRVAFGEHWVGGSRPTALRARFASISASTPRGLRSTHPRPLRRRRRRRVPPRRAPSTSGFSTACLSLGAAWADRDPSAAYGLPMFHLLRRHALPPSSALGRDRSASI